MLQQLVFSVTDRCPIACPFCVTRSHPRRTGALDAAFMIEAISEVHRLRQLRNVVFTGGEALLYPDDVMAAIRHAADLGLTTRIVTNAFWATSAKAARAFLARLKAAGLYELNISCDDLHQRLVPEENIGHAHRACRALRIPVMLAHKMVNGHRLTVERVSEIVGVKLKPFREGRRNPKYTSISTGLTVPVGHRSERADSDRMILYPQDPACWSAPCDAVLASVIIGSAKDIRLCCGMIEQDVPEISLGRWGEKPLEEMLLDADRDLIGNWLALEGPIGLKRFIEAKDASIPFRERYVNHCHLCNDILTRPETRAVLAAHGQEKLEELALRRALLETVRRRDPVRARRAA